MGEYIVSARKYRPMTFDTVVGQAALTATLKNAVKSGKLAHAKGIERLEKQIASVVQEVRRLLKYLRDDR